MIMSSLFLRQISSIDNDDCNAEGCFTCLRFLHGDGRDILSIFTVTRFVL